MTLRRSWAAGLTLLLLLSPAAHAQSDVAPLPPVAPTEPVPAPAPAEPVAPEPVPTTPVPTTPAPAEPAPVAPAAPAAPKPAPAKKPAISQAPLLITVEASLPVLKGGKKTTLPFSRTLTIPGPRMAIIRERAQVTASLDADLKTFLDSLESAPEDARFEELWDGWAVVQRNGLKIDRAATRAALEAAVKAQAVSVNVVVSGQVAPKRTLDFFQSRGITAHLGTGQTQYAGSSAARMTNIHVGTRNFQDRLFEGKTFSFNQFIGPVSARAGYVPGLIIAGDRTETGLGGGICQVSTTAFRAMYAAGLPVVERHTHSYQVFYYQPQGLDAAIYQPSLDLKFANDTGGALWFQAEWDDKTAQMAISVFGKPRDFTVQISAPRTLSVTPPPPDRLIRDASLPSGQRRQVDWAAPGAKMEVTRQFLRGGKVVKQDILRSSYRPWPNIFLVGR